MTPTPCARERELVVAVIAGRWPEACGANLRAHVDECAACQAVATLAAALRGDCVRAARDVDVPPPGLVWQRAIVSARAEAAQRASRPVAWAQGAAVACLVGAAIAAAVLSWPVVRGAAGRIVDATGRAAGSRDWTLVASPLVDAVGRSLPLALAIVGSVLAMPLIAMYLVWASERGE
jgi:predicted anti-sigma-YlaC factor YlaD